MFAFVLVITFSTKVFFWLNVFFLIQYKYKQQQASFGQKMLLSAQKLLLLFKKWK